MPDPANNDAEHPNITARVTVHNPAAPANTDAALVREALFTLWTLRADNLIDRDGNKVEGFSHAQWDDAMAAQQRLAAAAERADKAEHYKFHFDQQEQRAEKAEAALLVAQQERDELRQEYARKDTQHFAGLDVIEAVRRYRDAETPTVEAARLSYDLLMDALARYDAALAQDAEQASA